jgi:hypothetical protein
MAIGVDMYTAEIVPDLKATYPDITLECAFPCETQAVKWPKPLRDRYYNIAAKCDKETRLQTHCTPDCMLKRNQYMVNQANIILAVWDGRPPAKPTRLSIMPRSSINLCESFIQKRLRRAMETLMNYPCLDCLGKHFDGIYKYFPAKSVLLDRTYVCACDLSPENDNKSFASFAVPLL